MNRQRTVIYAERHRVLDGEDLHEQIRGMINEVISRLRRRGYGRRVRRGVGPRRAVARVPPALPGRRSRSTQLVEDEGGERSFLTADIITARMQDDAQAAYDRREAELTSDVMRELERRVILSVLDSKWREHLYEMDYLREGISLRAMAQRDPLIEYQREGFELFTAMMEGIKEESVGNLFTPPGRGAAEPDRRRGGSGRRVD